MFTKILFEIINVLAFGRLKSDKTQNWYNGDDEPVTEEDSNFEEQVYDKPFWQFPVKAPKVTSPFGKFRRLKGMKAHTHTGTDYSGAANKSAYAPCDIYIKKVLKPDYKYPCKYKWSKKKGWERNYSIPKGRAWTPYVLATAIHDKSIEFIFAHIDAKKIEVGMCLGSGVYVGTLGDYGNSLGAHLHFGIRYNGKYIDSHKFIKMKIKEQNEKT